MARLTERKIILVHRETRLDGLIRRHNTRGQAEFYIQSRGDSFADYRDEDCELKAALIAVENSLKGMARVQLLERSFLPNFLFGPDDLIVVSGQDGLVANTLKYLTGQPLIAINPAPQRFDGQLLPFRVQDIDAIITQVLNNRHKCKAVTMAQAELNDGQRLLAVNDLFIGPKLPVSAVYELILNSQRELQSSSGVLVSTGLGSTGWLRSVLTGACGIMQSSLPATEQKWDSMDLSFCVREPFPSRTTGTTLVYGCIQPTHSFSLTSRMAEGGIIFSDGIVGDAIEFNSGAIVTISAAEIQGQLVAS